MQGERKEKEKLEDKKDVIRMESMAQKRLFNVVLSNSIHYHTVSCILYPKDTHDIIAEWYTTDC